MGSTSAGNHLARSLMSSRQVDRKRYPLSCVSSAGLPGQADTALFLRPPPPMQSEKRDVSPQLPDHLGAREQKQEDTTDNTHVHAIAGHGLEAGGTKAHERLHVNCKLGSGCTPRWQHCWHRPALRRPVLQWKHLPLLT